MSKKTLTQLVGEMQGKSMTYGWDAVTLYDQRKANELLFQRYVERFNTTDGYIEPASMVASWGDGSYKEHIYDLKLSAPRLSFEKSNPSESARARLTMDMIGGVIVSTKKHSGGATYVSRMLKVLPVGGPQLWMSQPVTKGVVTGVGKVEIDIKNADTFMANFVFGDLAQDDVGKRFKQYFDEEVKPEQKVFPLGSLEGDLNGVLTPKNFEIRTMASDPQAVFGDENYGDGAVMMFITLKDGEDGKSYPSANSTYLIPADESGAKYTGAMLLSSRVLFDKIMRGPAIADIGHGINFESYQGGQDIHFPLKAISGGLYQNFHANYLVEIGGVGMGRFYFDCEIHHDFKIDDGGSPLTVRGGGSFIEFVWDKSYVKKFRRQINWFNPWTGDKDDTGDMNFDCSFSVRFDVELDKETGLVSFVRNEGTSAFELKISGGSDMEDVISQFPEYQPQMEAHFKPQIIALLSKLTAPTLDTFLLRNLLFPGENALQLSDAFVPGDLAVFGQIDPLRTTTVLSPMNSTIEAGSKLQFTLKPMPENVVWSVKDVDGKIAQPGVIGSTGEYTAPSADVLADGFVAAMVTAEGTLNGKPVKSSALVSVLHSAIVVNPTYDSCDPGKTIVLSAEGLGGEVLEWDIVTKQWGSTLTPVPDDPGRRTYTAGKSTDPDIPFSVDIIEIKKTANGSVTTAYIHVLIHNQMIGTALLMSEESDPSTGTVQFEIRGKNGPVDPSLVIWKLLAGEGSFNDKTGVYTEPTSPAPGSLIIVSATLENDFNNTHAVAAIPLPLSKYVELIETVNLTLKAG